MAIKKLQEKYGSHVFFAEVSGKYGSHLFFAGKYDSQAEVSGKYGSHVFFAEVSGKSNVVCLRS